MIYKQIIPETKKVYALYSNGERKRIIAWALYDDETPRRSRVVGLVANGYSRELWEIDDTGLKGVDFDSYIWDE